MLHLNAGAAAVINPGLSPIPDNRGLLYGTVSTSAVGTQSVYGIETGWQTPSSIDSNNGITRNQPIPPELGILGIDDTTQHGSVSGQSVPGNGLYASGLPWTPPTELSAMQFSDSSLRGISLGTAHNRAHSYDFSLPATPGPGVPWMDTSMVDMLSYGSNSLHTPASIDSASNNYFPSPATTPSLRQSPSSNRERGSDSGYHRRNRSDCGCFTACIDSLQTLHNASSPTTPAFDVVLTLNRRAVEGCASLLACPLCMGLSGTHTAIMLLATVMGKITSFYRNAWQAYFDQNVEIGATAFGAVTETDVNSNGCSSSSSPQSVTATALATGLGVSLGAYQLQGEDGRWLELQVLHRELRKLEEVYTRFQQVCSELSEDAEMSKAMVSYLGRILGSTLDLVNYHKSGLRYA